MADFLCILTDLTSLHFMVLFCFDNLRTGSVGSVQSTAAVWDHKIYDRERDSVNPMLQDEEDYEWGDKEDNERLDLSSESFTQGDWCLELSSSCRLQLLPFHIAYSEQEYPVTDRNKQHKQDECLPPSCKSLCSVSGQSVWVEVDSLKDGTEHLPSSDKCSEHERKVSYGDRKDSNREKERKSDTDNGACEYVQQYGSYLNLDLVAACCSLRELPLALDSTLLVAGADQQLDTLSSSLGTMLNFILYCFCS